MAEFYTYPDPKAIHGGEAELKRFNKALKARRQKYPRTINPQLRPTITNLNEKGCVTLPGSIPLSSLQKIKEELMHCLDNKLSLDNRFLKYGKKEPYVRILQPLVFCPTVYQIAFSELLLNIASEYFGCIPMMSNINLRRSFVKKSTAPVATQLYHADANSVNFLKFFMYLDDVDLDGGPFVYVEGSNNLRFEGWDSKARWTDQEIENIYGKSKVKFLTGKVGDLIVANTTGFHKGLQPLKQDRFMLTVYYTIHPNTWKKPELKLKKKCYNKLIHKEAADSLLII
jgi:hypothetical protein